MGCGMRKQVVGRGAEKSSEIAPGEWLDLDRLARVEITSENPDFPIENALVTGVAARAGWRASEPGPQTIRIHFDQPQKIRHIQLRFLEPHRERSQEFLLSYVRKDQPAHDIVRQQWTFSPAGSSEEIEDYRVDLDNIVSIELRIDPDRGLDRSPATLAELRIA